VVEMEVGVVAAGKEDFRLECANRQNVVLISIYLVLFCFALLCRGGGGCGGGACGDGGCGGAGCGGGVVVSGECWRTVWLIRRHRYITRTLLRKRIA
jgi:hypothetical protein